MKRLSIVLLGAAGALALLSGMSQSDQAASVLGMLSVLGAVGGATALSLAASSKRKLRAPPDLEQRLENIERRLALTEDEAAEAAKTVSRLQDQKEFDRKLRQ